VFSICFLPATTVNPNSAIVSATINATVSNNSTVVTNVSSGVAPGYPTSTENVLESVIVEFLIYLQVVNCDSSHDDLLWWIVCLERFVRLVVFNIACGVPEVFVLCWRRCKWLECKVNNVTFLQGWISDWKNVAMEPTGNVMFVSPVGTVSMAGIKKRLRDESRSPFNSSFLKRCKDTLEGVSEFSPKVISFCLVLCSHLPLVPQ